MYRNRGILQFVGVKALAVAAVGAVLVVVGIGAIKMARFGNSGGTSLGYATFVVKQGPLRISVTESGTIKAREQVILKSEVEGRTSILSLIPEGTQVKQGDLLVDLDSSQLLDSKIDQEIIVQKGEAAYVTASENLAVVTNQAQSDIDVAKLTLEFAELDLNKYVEGDYPNLLREAQGQIKLAEEELKRAEDKLTWSKKLFAEKYVSQTELQADELATSKAQLDLELAQNNLSLLEKYTYSRTLSQLNSDVKQAEMALERTERKARADVLQAEADLKAKESEFSRQKDKLNKIAEQIKKTKIYAPADGLVIYATSARRGGWRSRSEPLDVGQDVLERQELIYLPTASSAKAEVDIHEARLKKVRLGLPAIITVDALPGKTFFGEVAHIAPLPDAQSMWMNPDLKVYNSEIYLDSNDSTLRTGMSCKAEIIVEQYAEAIYVPVQAVLRVGGVPTVYVSAGETLEARQVEIGLDNDRMVRVMDGLEPGEGAVLAEIWRRAERLWGR
jgi:HlyD family secretion protein